MRGRIAIALVLGTLVFAAPPAARTAHAYVRAINDYGAAFYWPTSCATVTIYLNGFTMMTADEVAKSIAAAAHAWSPSEVTCPGPDGDAGSTHPYFEIIPSLSTGGPAPGVAYDNKNSIMFETTDWPYPGAAIALTSHFSTPDGAIVDTDMEINATLGTVWANLDPGALDAGAAGGHHLDEGPIDLQTALTHEFGHFLGLAHTCVNLGDAPAQTTDDQGAAVPACPSPPSTPGDVPQAQSVMWFLVDGASTTKRVLSPDDVRAVCDLYPSAQDPHTCAANLPDDGCGCQTGGGTSAGGAALLALAVAAALARRRRLRSDRDRRVAP
jgi:MYXO-CTERM domain-containing protein